MIYFLKYLFVLFFLSSCITKNIRTDCGDFYINLTNSDTSDFLFLSKLSKRLKNKLLLISNKDSNYICKIDLDFKKYAYSTITDTSGYSNRENLKIIINYILYTKDKNYNDNVISFYGHNISENYYSKYVNYKVISDNDVEELSDKLFYSILRKFRI